jgi:methionyl-tRNA formyltransferase
MLARGTLRVVFFCGDESPYGRAHLLPLSQGVFSLQAVVVPTRACWESFRERLLGGELHSQQPSRGRTSLRSLLARVRVAFEGAEGIASPWEAFEEAFPRSRVAAICKDRGIPVWGITDVNAPDVVQSLAEQRPDLLLCAAYPQIFGPALLGTAQNGGVNFHPSLLPRCRGANPIYWAITTGEKELGVTAHYMVQGLDAGDLLAQIPIPIEEEDDYWSLYEKVLRETPRLVGMVEAFFTSGRTGGIPQDPREATSFREPRTLHRRLFWTSRSAEALVRQVRAGEAFFVNRGQWITVRKATLVPTSHLLTNDLLVPSGTVIAIRQGELVIAAEGGGVAIREAVYRGRIIDGATLAVELRLRIGETLS